MKINYSFDIFFYYKGKIFDIDILPVINIYRCHDKLNISLNWLIFKFYITIIK
jgi:hypothetical protein